MSKIIKRFIEYLKSLRGNNFPTAPKVIESGEESMGAWFYLRDLLDRMDDYERCAKMMKRGDAEAYNLYSRIGACVVPSTSAFYADELPGQWRDGLRPAFGCLALAGPGPENDDLCPAEFVYFRKVRQLPNVQRSAGVLYEFTLMWSIDQKIPHFGKCYVSLDKNGVIKLLKENRKVSQNLPKGGQIKHTKWVYPKEFEGMPNVKESTLEKTVSDIFIFAANATTYGQSGFLVRAERNGIMTSFAIDMLRTPYFFKDRDSNITDDNGRKKKIFHIVRTHARTRADGSTGYVKSHFRGLRKFPWMGYQVTVSMSGYHHPDLNEFAATSFENEEGKRMPKNAMDSKKLGASLAERFAA